MKKLAFTELNILGLALQELSRTGCVCSGPINRQYVRTLQAVAFRLDLFKYEQV
mgnify:CR=1 FL=1